MGPYKSYSISVTPESFVWLSSTFSTLLDTPRTTRFFLEKRFEDNCLWVQKIHNRKGYLAEIFRVDDRGRKSCILVPEGTDKQGWAQFTDLLTLRKEAAQKRKTTTTTEDRGKKVSSFSSSSESDSPRRSYAEVLTNSSSSYSSSPKTLPSGSKKEETPSGAFDSPNWTKTVVITRRYFHDDWRKILTKLQEQLDFNITYKPFHTEKAAVSIEDKNLVNLLCKNRGWTTVGKYYVKFEAWNIVKHASPKLLPSYGGWVKFKGIPLHAWNYSSFYQIGEACGGFVEVAKNTRLDLFEADIKIKYNYMGFIPAFVRIADEEGNHFTIQTIVQAEGKWLKERNPRIHGTFTNEAAKNFNEFKQDYEQYQFLDYIAVSASWAISENFQDEKKKSCIGTVICKKQ